MSVTFDEQPLAAPEQDAELATEQVLALWSLVLAGELAYRDFIGIAAEVVTEANLSAWQLADFTVAASVLAGTGIALEQIGYDAPRWLRDPKRVERQIALMLNNAISAEVRDLLAQGEREAAMQAQDELRARKLARLVDNETAAAYANSEGVAILTHGEVGLVKGWIRQLGAPKAYPSRRGRGAKRGGASASPCAWCVTLNGGNAVRPWHYAMGRHDADRCRKQPVIVPLEQIGHLWRDSYARRLRIAQQHVARDEYGVVFEQSVLAG